MRWGWPHCLGRRPYNYGPPPPQPAKSIIRNIIG
jgi:hypothetical protein